MSNIILIAIAHEETGMCNSIEVLKILQSVKPNIFFKRLFQYSFNNVYGGRLPDALEPLQLISKENTAQYCDHLSRNSYICES